MPKSKTRNTRKKHNKKIQKRRQKLLDDKKRNEKYNREIFDKLLKEYEKSNLAKKDNQSDVVDVVDNSEDLEL